jgi:hypothetical protein
MWAKICGILYLGPGVRERIDWTIRDLAFVGQWRNSCTENLILTQCMSKLSLEKANKTGESQESRNPTPLYRITMQYTKL